VVSAVTSFTDRERVAVLGFYALAILLSYLVYQLFKPFLVPLAWAGVLTICFYPAHLRFERRFSPGRSALLSTALVALLVIVPLLAVASAFVQETSRMLGDVPRLVTETPEFLRRWLQAGLRYVPGGGTVDAAAVLGDAARRVAAFVSGQAPAVLQDLVAFVADLFLMIFALFFLFRDAPSVMAAIRRVIPLQADIRERLIRQTGTLVTASVTSSLIVSAVQGLLGGLTFWILGLTAPVFWGVVMAFMCLLPFGAWVVWAPAAIWLMFTGSVVRGLVLAGIGAGVVSAIDNFLRPILLSGHSKMNGLLLFVSLLGGAIAFGTVGLVLGPVLMATAVGLFDTFTSEPAPPPSEPVSEPADPRMDC
jgi:predicted PurR-regulated permease PerM